MKRSEGASPKDFSARATKSAMSLPAVNTPSDPANTTAPTPDPSRSASSSASRMASYIAPVSAFFFSGRASCTRRTPPG